MSFTREKAEAIAHDLGCETAVVLAVADVESGGRHDLPDGRPQILFEAHWFSKLTKHLYDNTHPNISSPVWDRSLYKGGTAEYGRLQAAMGLDKSAALKSASWGLFQIMGFNHLACGFATVEEFVEFIKNPDDSDMEAFCNFVKYHPPILRAMREKDWKEFALHYNGPGAVASYSAKLSDAYSRFKGIPDRATVGPPIPVADPTLKPKSVLTSPTIITTASATVGTVSLVAENFKPAIEAIQSTTVVVQQAGSAWQGFKDALGVFDNGNVYTLVVTVAIVAALLYIALRYIKKARDGDMVVK